MYTPVRPHLAEAGVFFEIMVFAVFEYEPTSLFE